MPVPRHFQMGVIPMENWILVNFLYISNMLRQEGGGVFIQIKQCLSMFLVKWFKKTKVHTSSIKLSINKFQIVKPSDILFKIFAIAFLIRHVSETKLCL